jgi:hypothetical protein
MLAQRLSTCTLRNFLGRSAAEVEDIQGFVGPLRQDPAASSGRGGIARWWVSAVLLSIFSGETAIFGCERTDSISALEGRHFW